MKAKLITARVIATTTLILSVLTLIPSSHAGPIQSHSASQPISCQFISCIQRPQIELVFVLDTTGSMSGLINAAKQKIWSIASTMASAQNAPDIKIGLVAYRDRGDSYITRTIDLSADLDSVYAQLMDFKAEGGGDQPESVNQALDDAVNKISWSQNKQSYKVIFLVGDAPAHMDYQDDIKYPKTIAVARQKGIVLNTIQAGHNSETAVSWQYMASLAQGHYFQVEQSGNAIAIATPYDRHIAQLSIELDNTRLYFGNKHEKQQQAIKSAATKKLYSQASDEVLARRADFNISKSGQDNFLGEQELVSTIASGQIELTSIAKEELPLSLQSLPLAEQKALLKDKAQQRTQLQQQMQQLTKQRNEYLQQQVLRSATRNESFDDKIFRAITEQGAEKGLHYDNDSIRY